MRQFLIGLLAVGLITACSDEAEKPQENQVTEHTVEQSAEQAASAMEAAGDEVEVVADTADEAVTEAAQKAGQAADEAAAAAQETAEDAASEVEQAADEVAGREPKAIYTSYCSACHDNGVAGAPRVGDTAAWQQRVDARGRDALVQNALDGYKAMPAMGTCSDCSDEEMAATVDWMLAESGL